MVMKIFSDPVIVAFVAIGVIATIGFFLSIFLVKFLHKSKK